MSSSSILTKAEQSRLADSLIELAHRGFGYSKDDLLDAVKKLVEADGCKTLSLITAQAINVIGALSNVIHQFHLEVHAL